MMDDTQLTDDTTYRAAAATLRAGMLASFAAMSVGLVWWLLSGSPGGNGAASRVMPFDHIMPELLSLNPLALLNLGVLLLLATPGVTLISQLIAFGMARNWRFAAITALVGAIILVSLSVSLGWVKLF